MSDTATKTAADPRLETVPAGRLIGIDEVAQVLGIERAAVDQIRVRDRRGRKQSVPLPTPILPRAGAPRTSPMWDVEEIKAWAKLTGREQRAERGPIEVE